MASVMLDNISSFSLNSGHEDGDGADEKIVRFNDLDDLASEISNDSDYEEGLDGVPSGEFSPADDESDDDEDDEDFGTVQDVDEFSDGDEETIADCMKPEDSEDPEVERKLWGASNKRKEWVYSVENAKKEFQRKNGVPLDSRVETPQKYAATSGKKKAYCVESELTWTSVATAFIIAVIFGCQYYSLIGSPVLSFF